MIHPGVEERGRGRDGRDGREGGGAGKGIEKEEEKEQEEGGGGWRKGRRKTLASTTSDLNYVEEKKHVYGELRHK